MTRAELIAEIRALSEKMLDVAVKIDYFCGLDAEMSQYATELAGAAGVAATWADGIEAAE